MMKKIYLIALCLFLTWILIPTQSALTNSKSPAISAGLDKAVVGVDHVDGHQDLSVNLRSGFDNSSSSESKSSVPAEYLITARSTVNDRIVNPFGSFYGNSSVVPFAAFSATKSAVLAAGGDVNSNGFVNPGDTLQYSVLISNPGADV